MAGDPNLAFMLNQRVTDHEITVDCFGKWKGQQLDWWYAAGYHSPEEQHTAEVTAVYALMHQLASLYPEAANRFLMSRLGEEKPNNGLRES